MSDKSERLLTDTDLFLADPGKARGCNTQSLMKYTENFTADTIEEYKRKIQSNIFDTFLS